MLQTTFLKKRFSNPTILASGIMGVSASSLIYAANSGAGAVTTKSLGPKARDGHKNPVIIEWEHGIMNAVGLSNPGIDDGIKEVIEFKQRSEKPIMASIFAHDFKEFKLVAKKVNRAKPDFVEVNISCPNVQSEFGAPFASNEKDSARVTSIVKAEVKVPVIIKLSPNVSNIAMIAKACEKKGADAICAINTVGPGMMIDIDTAKPILSNKCGGLSGPAIKPIAIRCVYDIYNNVKIPIIGLGGITNGRDAAEMLMAGASLIGIGSAVHFRGISVFRKVCSELQNFMADNKYSSIKELVGRAH